MPRVLLRDIRRRYPGEIPTDALTGVSLTIEQGEFLALQGPSGGGKSTLLNIIGLLDAPTAGSYQIGDTETGTASARVIAELRSDRFAFIFQSFHLLDKRPVIDSVELGLMYRGVPRAQRQPLAAHALGKLGLAHLCWQQASKLSGGERQRVAIARALASGAPIVVADEPTGNLDSQNSEAVVDSLRTLHKAGSTIVLVTHSPEVATAAERQVHIRDGKLLDAPADQRPADHAVDEATGPPVTEPPASEPKPPPGRASRLRTRDLVTDAIASVRSRIGRTAGLVAAVALGVALAVATLGIAVSAGAQVSDTFNAHTNRDVTMQWKPKQNDDQSGAARASIVHRLAQLRGSRAVGILENYGRHGLQAGPARPTFQITTYAVTPHFSAAARSKVTWAPGHSEALASGEILLGANLAEQLNLGPLIGGPVVLLDDRPVTAVGVVDASPRVPDILGAVVAPASDAHLLGYLDQVKALLLTDAGAAQQIARQAPLVIDPYSPDSLTVDAPTDPTTLRAQVESAVQSTLVALTGVALLASIAGLANAMVLSVIERRQEFGLRRALGARPKHIVGLVLTESTIIGAIGGLVGLIAGLGAILVITVARHWSPVFDLRLAPIAVAGGILVGAVGGILASVRASRIQPNEALRL